MQKIADLSEMRQAAKYVSSCLTNAMDSGIKPGELAAAVKPRILDLQFESLRELVSNMRDGYGTFYLPYGNDRRRSARKRLYRVSVILNVINTPDDAEVIGALRAAYGDDFVYPPE